MIRQSLCALAFIASIGSVSAQESHADHHGHSQSTLDKHAQFHPFYQTLRRPTDGMSCCSGMDCSPISARATPNGIEVQINGNWLSMPAQTVIETETPDQGAHWCGFGENTPSPVTYCVIIPRGNT